MELSIPDPFDCAISSGRPHEVCDVAASSAAARYGRAIARLQVGRIEDARSDFETAKSVLGDICVIELLNLDMVARRSLDDVLRRCREVLGAVPAESAMRARTCHIIGTAQGRRRNIDEATKYLVEACSIYRNLGDRAGWARVQDTLGCLYFSQGRLDLALGAFAFSMVEKSECGDRYGMAVTLGNIGRAHLRLGRFHEARECFERNYRFASEIGNSRVCARILEDKGRVHLAMNDLENAEACLRECIEISASGGFNDLEFFARKDLVKLYAAAVNLERGAEELEIAERLIPESGDPYFLLLLDEARGVLYLAKGDDRALEVLERTAREFGEWNLPDNEIPLLLTLAEAYRRRKLREMAQFCLNRARERAKRDGYERFLRPIREAIARIGDVDWRGLETNRLAGRDSSDSFVDGYTIFEFVGGGAFGKVYRAHDPLQDQIVALKRIELQKIYDMSRRDDLLTSAKLELEVASHIRHPGVARVFALGVDSSGDLYIAQEFITGKSLRKLMAEPNPEPAVVFRNIRLIASALEALHRRGIMHRDLKPENVLLRKPHDTPVLVDFGLAQVAGFGEGFGEHRLLGTLPYIAPEQFDNPTVDSRADMYSLGVILYEWLTDRQPRASSLIGFEPYSEAELDTAMRPLREEPRHHLELVDLTERLLHPDPQMRPSAAIVVEICDEVASGESEWESSGSIPKFGGTSGMTDCFFSN